MTDNPLLHNLQPVNFRVGEHEPVAFDPNGSDNQPASRLTVVLPGEIAQAVVTKVISRDAVVCQLGSLMCTGRGHSYRPKEFVPVRREVDPIAGEQWRVISDRELQMSNMLMRFEEAERAKALPSPGKALPSPHGAKSSDPAELSSTVAPQRGREGHSDGDFTSRVKDADGR
jgi:hypothetical protein